MMLVRCSKCKKKYERFDIGSYNYPYMCKSCRKKFSILLVGLAFLFTIIFLTQSISAEQIIFRQNDMVDIKIQCIINGTFCSGSANCNITLNYPNNTLLLNNAPMTNAISYYNYTLSDSSIIGDYPCSVTCCDGVYCGTNQDCSFSITPTGLANSTGNGILNIILIIGVFIIFIITIYGAVIFPWKNPRDDEDKIISINNLKYLKVVLWVITYLEFLFIVMILKNLSTQIPITGAFDFFNITFSIMLGGIAVLFPGLIFFTVVIWLNDKKTQKKLRRGLPV